MTTVTAARILAGQLRTGESGEEYKLGWDDFPVTGLSKVYNVDQTVSSGG